ncbi:hypothetical protein SAMN05660841_04083 [Sphingobacterium nematocida]|uniref:Uncharacterized protein n=1 Tax=Sphingobacterium nematocida TaxID=1513896 RepID=A0A1T5GHZ0_9SPHI|nr:hypothetical protein [Sphingobacterium nematocida]SKC08011.1 hypothetical protein SAMN05660841_04083 [Sphingobacterium nematocida]
MKITHIVLIIIDTERNTIELLIREFVNFKAHALLNKPSTSKTIAVTTNSVNLAKNIRSGIEAILFNEVVGQGNSSVAYSLGALPKVVEILNVFQANIKEVEVIKDLNSLLLFEDGKLENLKAATSFYKNFEIVTNQIDTLIKDGALFDKRRKSEIISIIYDRNLKILDELSLAWIYNRDNNIVINYSEIVKWKVNGSYPECRQLVEMRYFL